MNVYIDFKSGQCGVFDMLCASRKLEGTVWRVVFVWKRGTCIVLGTLQNGVLRSLLGFMERNYWIVLCLIVLYPTSKGRNLGKWNKMELGFCCWTVTFMTSWLLREDQKWSHPLRSRVFCCNVRVCRRLSDSGMLCTFCPSWTVMLSLCWNTLFL